MTCTGCGGEIKGGFCARCGKELLLGARGESYSKDAGVNWIPSDRRPDALDHTGWWNGGRRILPKPTGSGR